jgi:phosphoribosylformylglycinamidine cyclo-ligase
MTRPLTYADAGLNLETYAKTMHSIGSHLTRTWSEHVIRPPFRGAGGKGGSFASLFDLGALKKYRHPVLVNCTDGVGSKLKIAMMMKRFDTVGQDLVAMSVNDLICTGAEPLVFLDYLAMHADDPELTTQLVKGIADACEASNCSLVGGETAILPDFYQPGDFDMAGFATGVVEKDDIIDGSKIAVGDVVIGLASSGVHSNGYSLVRKIVFDAAKLSIDTHVPELGRTVGEELLEPTRLYPHVVQAIVQQWSGFVHGLANITGGGLPDNVGRILPPNRRVVFRRSSWPRRVVFEWLQQLGHVADDELARVFNLGIGFVVIVDPSKASEIMNLFKLVPQGAKSLGEAFVIGEVVAGEAGVEIVA